MQIKNYIYKLIGISILCSFLLGCSEEKFLLQEETADIIEATATETASDTETAKEEMTIGNNELPKEDIVVHICGAVNHPGVYYLTEGQRLYELIHKAGGFREDANEDYLNQAMSLVDGMKITVPTMEETASETMEEEMVTISETSGQGQKININTADETLLCTLPGIGESRAKSIIAYRQEYGDFRKTEDIMNIPGIKEAAFAKIRDYITVSD
ncbi:MAG: helix-hairpin-helix domain-containing protein [Lachnospiraceae bacterium]|nr:helix-hairpin-helix domain-containing protein [Lachnospiraceae bacterium]